MVASLYAVSSKQSLFPKNNKHPATFHLRRRTWLPQISVDPSITYTPPPWSSAATFIPAFITATPPMSELVGPYRLRLSLTLSRRSFQIVTSRHAPSRAGYIIHYIYGTSPKPRRAQHMSNMRGVSNKTAITLSVDAVK